MSRNNSVCHQLFFFFLLVVPAMVWGAAINPDQAKTGIKTLLLYEIEELQKAKDQPPPPFLSARVPLQQWEKYEMTPEQWRKEIDSQLKPLQNLLALVDHTAPERLAESITRIYWGEARDPEQYPSMVNYVVALGELAVVYIERDFDKADTEAQIKMLGLLGHLRSRSNLAIVRKGMDSADERVSASAQTALVKILGIEAKPELEKMLVLSKNSWSVMHTLGEMALTGDPDWYRSFFAMVRKGSVTLQDMVSISNPDNCPEGVIGENADFLAQTLLAPEMANNHGDKFWAKDLILRLDRPEYIRHLTGLLPGLLHDRYRYGGTLKPYSSLSAAQQEKTFGFFDNQADILIAKIIAVLSVEDMSGMLSRSANTLERLYLASVLKLKTGQSAAVEEESFGFGVEVLDGSGKILASQEFFMKPGEHQVIAIAPSDTEYVERHLETTLRLDRSEWSFVMACVIDFKPHGAGFDLIVPMGGTAEMHLYDTVSGERELLVWRFRHIARAPRMAPTPPGM